MPRDGSGNYTLPAGNPVITGTTIDVVWANPTMADVATALTDSLSRTGSGGMLVPFLNADGSVALPGISFVNEPSSGIYRAAANDIRFSVAGVDKARVTSDAINPLDIFVGGMFVPVVNEGGDYTPSGTWDFVGLVTFDALPVTITGGGSFVLFDAGDTDSMTISHNGTNLNIANLNTTNFQIRDGVVLRVFDPGDVGNIFMSHDATDGTLGSTVGNLDFTATGANFVRMFPRGELTFSADGNGECSIIGDANIAGDIRRVLLRQADLTLSGIMGHQNSGDMVFDNREPDERVVLAANDGGALRNFYIITPDDDTQIHSFFQDATEVFRMNIPTLTDVGMGAQVADAAGTLRPVGMNIAPIIEQNADITFDITAVGRIFVHDEATPRDWTVDQVTTMSLGAIWGGINFGTGAITLISGAGVSFEFWDGATFINTSGDVTVGVGQWTITKRTDILYVINGPDLS